MKYEQEAREIILLVGKQENIQSLVHCATRLRFELKDAQLFQKEALEKLSYVLKVIVSGGQYQVVIGPAVDDYYEAILKEINIQSNQSEVKVQSSFGDKILKLISGAFSPLIPLLAGSGMIKAVLTMLTETKILGYEDSTYLILSAAGNACFYFLPVFLGLTLSKQLKVNRYVGAAIGAALLEPNFTGLLEASKVHFLNIPVTPISYASTIFPIFIAIFVFSWFEKFFKKWIPQSIQLFLVPMLCLILMVPFTVIVFGPFGTTFGDLVSQFVMWLFSLSGTLAGVILGAIYPFLTMFGLHWGFTPITLQNLDKINGDIIEGVCVCAVWAQIGIAAGAYAKAKRHSKMRAIAGPSFITGVFAGVTEPILYTIVMEYKRLMAVVAIAGGLGGAVAGTFGVTMNAYVFHNIFSVAVQSYSPMPAFLPAIGLAFIGALLMTYFWGLSSEDANYAEIEETVKLEIMAPVKGEVIELNQVKDEVFASGVAGQGVAIEPSEGCVFAPVEGVVSVLFPSKHAVGITTNHGLEILVHVGINTVMLNGEGFTSHVKQGQRVCQGELLLEFDRDLIQSKGYSLQTPVLITNSDKIQGLVLSKNNHVDKQTLLYQVVM